MYVPDWLVGFLKMYLIMVVILLHHEIVIRKSNKIHALLIAGLWLPYYIWKWLESIFGSIFDIRRKRKEKKVEEKVAPPNS